MRLFMDVNTLFSQQVSIKQSLEHPASPNKFEFDEEL